LRQDQQVLLAHKAYQELRLNLEELVLLDQQVLRDHEVQLVQQAIKVLTEPVVLLDQLARQVLQVLVLQVLLAFKVYKVI
jgi:hypothetical protein